MEKLFPKPIIPVAVVNEPDRALALAEALLAGGLDVIEITFRTPNAAACIDRIRGAFPSMMAGAGTLIESEQVRSAVGAGARFGVAPGVNPKIVLQAMDLGLPFIPGVMTASEIEQSLELDCKLLKFFPAEAAGGVKMLKALAGPFIHTGVKFMPSGGVSMANMADYLALSCVALVGGSWLVEEKLIAEKNWKKVTELTVQSLAIAQARSTGKA
jgi:2-dehydro-3-deoxyphosphogluconate aldolase/(4S)-4-hydroxy-2-oxoglutarate aldolase